MIELTERRETGNCSHLVSMLRWGERRSREREKGKGRIRSLSSRGNVYGRVMRKERKRRAEGEKREERSGESHVPFTILY